MTTRHARRKPKLGKLDEQVIVLTGATSGIGLATARMAAARGARLVLAARNDDAVQQLAAELKATGADAIGIAADVAREDDVERIVEAARTRFGGFDTWINNAAVSMYGHLADEPIEDERQLFETNYWGTVHGSRAAVRHLRERGGALINVGSANSDYAAPLQGAFSASKHAVKGYTDALRMELEEEGAPVSVTLVKPSPIDTPYPAHARNHLENEPRQTPPLYAPEVAAKAILFCAEHPKRDVYVGGAGKLFATAGRIAPRFMDRIMSRIGTALQQRAQPDEGGDSLYRPNGDMRERGEYNGYVMKSSAYTNAALHPKLTGSLILASGAIAALLWRANRARNRRAGIGALTKNGEATRLLKKAGRKLKHPGARVGIAQALPEIGRTARHAVERNLPRH